MKLQLINEVNQQFTPIEQILYNRGISKDEFYHYLNFVTGKLKEDDLIIIDMINRGVLVKN